ncbi:MAG: hypothetical protein ACJAZS_000379 [Alteromonas naphthalenivorans]|jgi:hypothetical protein
MQKKRKVIVVFSHNYFKTLLLATTFCSGIIFFMVHNQWLIIHINTGKSALGNKTLAIEKKSLRLHFWHEDSWHHEDTEILWSQDNAKNILYSTNRWLSLLDEEAVHSKKVTLQSVTLSSSGTIAYISFDRYPFEPESSTYDKYMFIEGLLKTLREQPMPITHLYFLVHHKFLDDYHLDFSHPWPLKSFLQD